MGTTMLPGRVLGRAGGGLEDASWALNEQVARQGQRGELRTARVLDELAARPGGPTVLHDVMIPHPRYRANIDHVVVAGTGVWLVDSKMWRPGFYWRLGANTRRGLTRVPHADKHTLNLGRDVFARELSGTRARLHRPVLVAWPSNQSTPMRTWAVNNPEQETMSGDRFLMWAHRMFSARGSRSLGADETVVAVLAQHLVQPTGRRGGRRETTPWP